MSKNEVAIEVKNVSKYFLLPHQKAGTLKNFILNPFSRYENKKQFALKDVSFQINKGDFFGIVGRNGSGKSTLLKCIAGIYPTDNGQIKVEGTLVPFIELGVGFNPELSGRDNVYLNGALLGFSRQEIESMYKDIVEFAELDEYMDQKLKNYSSGMQVRLAFSIAVRADGDILLLDEVLAVGDTEFQQKCFSYFEKIRKLNKTILFVSHDTNALRKFCRNGVLIEKGKLISSGPIDIVLDDYSDLIQNRQDGVKRTKTNIVGQIGSGKAKLEEIKINDNISKQSKIDDSDKNLIVNAVFLAKDNIESPVFGITITDMLGTSVFSSNTLRRGVITKDMELGQSQEIQWTIPNIFNNSEYNVSVAITDKNGKEIYDRSDNIVKLEVSRKYTSTALTNPDHTIKLL